ncbi:MAG TPA: glycosyltransferase, partial [Candidatus Saccharimonadales bacterium]|nr:glycosyltransferase [Candidatus Saccharimonadales bacterium]
MRIGIDARLWNETGVGRYIRNLVRELAKIDKENEYILFFRQSEFETVPLPGKNFEKRLADVRWHSIQEQTKLPKIFLSENLDIMHFPYFSYPIFYKKPFVITIHDLIIDHFPTGKASTLPQPVYWLKQVGYKYILSQAIKHAKKIIAVSKATKQEIMEHYHPNTENVVVTYEGIDEAVSKEEMEAVDVKRPYFLYVGNAYPHKNLERLMEGFAEFLHTAKEDAYLILVGKEDYFYTRLKELVRE